MKLFPRLVTIGSTFLLWLAAPCTEQAFGRIEFSAALQDFTGEGIVYHRLVFQDDKQTIFYQPPPAWTCHKIENSVTLTPPNKKFAEAQISATSRPQTAALDEQVAAQVAQYVLANLPPTSQAAQITHQQIDPLLLHGNPGIEIIASYQAFGETLRRAVVVVCTPNEEIVFKLSARSSDFEPLYRAFRASISSWDWQSEPAAN